MRFPQGPGLFNSFAGIRQNFAGVVGAFCSQVRAHWQSLRVPATVANMQHLMVGNAKNAKNTLGVWDRFNYKQLSGNQIREVTMTGFSFSLVGGPRS
jgi:hypothetical protein